MCVWNYSFPHKLKCWNWVYMQNTEKSKLFPPGIEQGTFCVLDRCDNRYTTKTCCFPRHLFLGWICARYPGWEVKEKSCVGRESNPDQLLGRQLCWPLYHRRLRQSESVNCSPHLAFPKEANCHQGTLSVLVEIVTPVTGHKQPWGYSSVVEQSAAVR